MAKYKLEHDRENCIGCAACTAVNNKHWKMGEDGKADIVDSKKRDDGWEELDLEEEEFLINKEAADSCPVNVIHITDKKTNKRII